MHIRKNFHFLNDNKAEGAVKGILTLAQPQSFPLTLAGSKRGEGPSRTLNKGGTPLCLTGGLLSSLPAHLKLPAIQLRNPSHRSFLFLKIYFSWSIFSPGKKI